VTARADLRADCARCFAICCVAPAFARSSDFAVDKPAGVPCPNLADDHRCSIHDRLRPEGFAGCAAYDCFGAGQRLAQETFGGRDWRTHRDVAVPMMAALPILRGLHELLWYVDEALALPSSAPIADRLRSALADVTESASAPADRILDVVVDDLRARLAPLLREASRLARAGFTGPDLSERDLSGADLRASSFRDCSWKGTRLVKVRLSKAGARAIPLSSDQRKQVDLQDDEGPEPEGG